MILQNLITRRGLSEATGPLVSSDRLAVASLQISGIFCSLVVQKEQSLHPERPIEFLGTTPTYECGVGQSHPPFLNQTAFEPDRHRFGGIIAGRSTVD